MSGAKITDIYQQIVKNLELYGHSSPYQSDANEPDPRYKSYGVRAQQKIKIFRTHQKSIRNLLPEQQIELATRLVHSEYGEQQSIGLFILEKIPHYFTPDRFNELHELVSHLHGWSKIDSFSGSLLRDILFQNPQEFLKLVSDWNGSQDMWLRRASVVLFTRKVAASGLFNDFGLKMCNNLLQAEEDLVRKGVGWALKDMMRSDRERILKYVHELRKKGVSSMITLYAIRGLKGTQRAEFLATE